MRSAKITVYAHTHVLISMKWRHSKNYSQPVDITVAINVREPIVDWINDSISRHIVSHLWQQQILWNMQI